MLTVIDFPRSGTHWLRAMLGYALDEQLVHSHAFPEIVENQCVLIVRDPRDAFASRCRLRGVRRDLEKEELDLFLRGPNPGEPEWRIGWEPYTRKILELAARFPRRAPLVRYEQLYAAPEEVLAQVLATIGRDDISAARIAEAVRRTRGVRCDPSDFPEDENMGRPGKWEAQLEKETARALLEDCGELMVEMGYLGKEGGAQIVILLKTWQGPNETIARKRLARAGDVLVSLDEHLEYPDYSWHIADDGSAPWYVEAFRELMGDRPYTFTSSGANGDIGRNLNVALREVMQRADCALHWSDDILLNAPMNIEPYVELLRGHDDIGYVSTRNLHPSLNLRPIERDGRTWNIIEKTSPNPFLTVTSLNLMHRRAWDFYGPYPEGLRIDTMQREMAWRYRSFEGGLEIVIPEELLHVPRIAFDMQSTWDWRLEDEREQVAWHRYRCYSARFERD